MAEETSGILVVFKKIGFVGIIAAVVSAIITTIPFLFKLDERYAKADELDANMVTISKQINDLTIEVGRLAGTQQVMVAIMSAAPAVRFAPVPERRYEIAAPIAITPPVISTTVPKTPEERNTRLADVTKSLEHTQAQVQSIQNRIPSVNNNR